jgi:histidyl-tRNA synthetase
LLPAFDESIDVYVVVPDPQYAVKAFTTVQDLRNANLTVEYDYVGRSMKGQMKQANKLMAKHVLIFGSDEGARGNVTLKNMASSEQKEIALNDVVKILKTEVQKHE